MSPLARIALPLSVLLSVSAACGGSSSLGETDAASPSSSDSGSVSDAHADLDAGSGSDASEGGGICIDGGLMFEFLIDGGSVCLGESSGCTVNWLSIGSGPTNFRIDMPCETTCGSCQSVACPEGCAVEGPTSTTATESWNGTYYASSTCGEGMACVTPSCVPAGHYIATMCGYTNANGLGACGTVPSAGPTCVQVPFDWPPTSSGETVVGLY